MSALGHKRTFAPQNVMSALPPKADMCGATGDVRFGPKADIERTKNIPLATISRYRMQRAVDVALFPSLRKTKAHDSDGHDDEPDHK
jgi:hypothetical protein